MYESMSIFRRYFPTPSLLLILVSAYQCIHITRTNKVPTHSSFPFISCLSTNYCRCQHYCGSKYSFPTSADVDPYTSRAVAEYSPPARQHLHSLTLDPETDASPTHANSFLFDKRQTPRVCPIHGPHSHAYNSAVVLPLP